VIDLRYISEESIKGMQGICEVQKGKLIEVVQLMKTNSEADIASLNISDVRKFFNDVTFSKGQSASGDSSSTIEDSGSRATVGYPKQIIERQLQKLVLLDQMILLERCRYQQVSKFES